MKKNEEQFCSTEKNLPSIIRYEQACIFTLAGTPGVSLLSLNSGNNSITRFDILS